MSNNAHPYVRVVDATFVEEKKQRTRNPLDDDDDEAAVSALQRKTAKDLAVALAPVAGVIVAGLAFYDAASDLVKQAKRNARRRQRRGL